jgi:hypothetical protein
VSSTGDKITEALRAGDFETALQLITAYQEAVSHRLSYTARDVDRDTVLREAMEVLQSHLHLARVMRAHLVTTFGAVKTASVYQPVTDTVKSTWDVEG